MSGTMGFAIRVHEWYDRDCKLGVMSGTMGFAIRVHEWYDRVCN